MGINNIHVLINPAPDNIYRVQTQAQTVFVQSLAEDHRRGKHPWGSMRRDCPLCQQDK